MGSGKFDTLKILFASTYCLLDTASGAAVNTRAMLEGLFDFGVLSQAVTASIFDPQREVRLESVLSDCGRHDAQSLRHGRVLEVTTGKLKHSILFTSSSRRSALTAGEEDALIALVEEKIREFQPNVILSYGGIAAERRIHHLARSYGIPVIFFLANGQYTKAETFRDVDLIYVPSSFLSQYYYRRLGIRSRVLYPVVALDKCMVDPELNVAPSDRRFITYINPVPNKGLGLFLRLAARAAAVIPEAEFLVVEGRWTRENLEQIMVRLGGLPNVKFASNRPEIKSVYACTRILLFPSFWEEGFGQSIVEAQLNGIPVIASRRGGISEAMNGGGFLLDVPERCTQDYNTVPTDEEVRPWLDTIRALTEERETFEKASERALHASQRFRFQTTIQEAANLFFEFHRGRHGPS